MKKFKDWFKDTFFTRLIWCVRICSREDGYPLADYYFKYYRHAEKCFNQLLEEYPQYIITFGGDTLLLCNIGKEAEKEE